jgi:hypothetical protein
MLSALKGLMWLQTPLVPEGTSIFEISDLHAGFRSQTFVEALWRNVDILQMALRGDFKALFGCRGMWKTSTLEERELYC